MEHVKTHEELCIKIGLQESKYAGQTYLIISDTFLLKPYEIVHNLLSKGITKKSQIILAGQHKYGMDELAFLKRNNIHFVPSHKILHNKIPKCDTVIIDTNCLDYAVLRNNNPGGLQLNELQKIVPAHKKMYVLGNDKEYSLLTVHLNV